MQISGIIPQIAIHHLETKNNWCAVLFWSNVNIQLKTRRETFLSESDKILNKLKLLSFAEMKSLNLLVL